MKIGTLNITDCKIGNTQISEVRIGNTLVWSNAVAYDADAQAYFTVNTSITLSADKDAINAFFVGNKADGTHPKMKAMYLLIWGSAAMNKWNLKDPRDLDAAFRLLFFGGITHDSTGITGNGTTGYANTKLLDDVNIAANDKHISMYRRDIPLDPSGSALGAGATTNRFYLNFGNQNYSTLGMLQSPFAITTPQRGMFCLSKTASGSYKYYQNSLTPFSRTGANAANIQEYYLFNNPGRADWSIANLSFVSIGDGLTDAQYTALQGRVNTLMTHFGLNV